MIKKDFSSFLLYTFSFFLLWEWLRPIEQLTETDHIEMFIIFLVISFALSFFNFKWIWKNSIKTIFILYSINQFHYEEGLFEPTWILSFFRNIIDNFGLLAARNWNGLSYEFRTLLFFILLWLMVYLIDYWILNRKRIFIFFFMTLVYITVLDTFTPYVAKFAIVRTVVAGFAVMGMLTYYRIIQKENVSTEPALVRKWMVPIAVMISLSVLVGIAAPKAAPIWPDPVPYLTANNDKVPEPKASVVHRIGYGTNDSKLGGPFLGDNNPVFRYDGNGKNYWKMETKDVYTGKGWLASGTTPITFRQEDLVPVFSLPETVESTKESARVVTNPSYNFNYLMYPAGINKVLKMLPDGNRFEIDTTNERISLFTNENEPSIPRAFTIEFEKPKYKDTNLVQTTSYDPTSINKEFYQEYTLLPKNLPPRVKELAEEITVSKTNWFDKAKAVESYFGKSDFTYDQKNVAVPDTEDDYVDQFLFETKRGYCDNFSSSMAVMLRTLGIPTRWVKGFTGGDFLQYSDVSSGRQLYEVTNNNAHSWVEVYFPNQGWVPFEPTKGFSNPIIINYELNNSASSSNNELSSTPPPVKKPQQEEVDHPKTPDNSNKLFDINRIWTDTQLFMINNWKLMMLDILLIAGVVVIVFRIRGKWVPYLLLAIYRFKKKDDNIGAAYLALLKQFDRYGLKRKEHQTLRNYARYIDSFFSTREMTRLTAIYENYLYHQNLPEGTWEDSQELWENLIKKTIA